MVGELSKGPDVGNWSLANQHLLNTVRILVRRKDGSHSVGTGFMHRFCETGDEAIQCVVTNRHVISESVLCELVFRSRKVDAVDAPVVASTIRFEEGFEERWFKHPDERVDQCVGTGFMHRFCETGDGYPVCGHVISESVLCELVFRSRKVDAVDAPVVASTIRFEEGFEERWFKHPDERVDLAVLPVSNEFRQMLGNGFTPLYKATQLSQLVTAEAAAKLNAVEEILMVGYPNGLWDETNNLPITRRGITASPVSVGWNGRNEFLIDCSVYPGSSGSPIYLFSPSGTRLSVEHRLIPTNQVMLLGVVKSVFVHTVGGEVQVSPAPTASEERGIPIPNDLGLCTRADELLYFETHFRDVMERKGPGG